MMRQLSRYLPALLLALIVVSAVQLYTHYGDISASILPSPWRVMQTLSREWQTIVKHAKQTLLETILGFSLAIVSALTLALLMDRWQVIRLALYPWLIASQTLPIVALAPLMIVWFGFGLLPKVLLVALFCFFPMVVATSDGLARADHSLTTLMQSMRASYWQELRLVRFPLALPSFFSGLKIAITYSVTAAIFAEFAGGYRGLGILMQTSAKSRATSLIFAGILVTALASLLLFLCVLMIEKLVIRWKN